MVDIQIGEKLYKDIPENYDELNLRKFIELSKFFEESKQLQKEKPTQYSVKLLNIILSAPIKEIYKLNTSDFTQLVEFFEWLGKMPKKSKRKTVKIDGKEYKFLNYNDITTGEHISIETVNNGANNRWDVLHVVYAVLCRPVKGKKKEIIDLEEKWSLVEDRAELFLDKMMIGEVYGNLVNFTNGAEKFTKTSQASSTLTIKRKKKASS